MNDIHSRFVLKMEQNKVRDGLSGYQFDTITIRFAKEQRSYLYHEPVDPLTIAFVDLICVIGLSTDFSIHRNKKCTLPQLLKGRKEACMCSLFENWYAVEPYTIDEEDILSFTRTLSNELKGATHVDPNKPLEFMDHLNKKCVKDKGFLKALQYIAMPHAKKIIDRPFGRCEICIGYYGLPFAF